MYKIIKLTNGMELIGDVLINKENDMVLAIDKPMQINYRVFSNASMPSISLIRYSLLAENEPVMFHMKDVMNLIEPKKTFVDYYTSTVDSAFEHYDQIIDRELKIATARQSLENDQDGDVYSSLLQNFESETIN